jgi:hypothetical protein
MEEAEASAGRFLLVVGLGNPHHYVHYPYPYCFYVAHYCWSSETAVYLCGLTYEIYIDFSSDPAEYDIPQYP